MLTSEVNQQPAAAHTNARTHTYPSATMGVEYKVPVRHVNTIVTRTLKTCEKCKITLFRIKG